MPLVVSRLALFIFLIALFTSPASAQDFELTQKVGKKMRIGGSVRVFQTSLVDYKVFDFFNGRNSANSKNYTIDVYYDIGEKIFLAGGIGITEISRNIRGSKTFEYTELGNLSTLPNQILQPYQVAFESDFHEHEIAFNLHTQKMGDLLDIEEGDPLYLKLYDLFDFYYLSIPAMINYKLSGKNISIYGGIGTQFNFRVGDANKRADNKQYFLSIANNENSSYSNLNYIEWSRRNNINEIDLSYKNKTHDFLVDLILKVGLLRDIRRNTFALNLVYNRTLNGFLDNTDLEGLGMQIGWMVRVN